MPFVYKCDVIALLKQAGYNTNRIRKEKLLSESTLQKLRCGQMISLQQIDVIAHLLKCHPSAFIEYTENFGERQ